MKNIILLFIVLIQYGCAGDSYYYEYDKKVNLTPKTSFSRSDSNIDYYTVDNGMEVGVTNQLIVKLKDDTNLKKYLDEFNLTIVKKLAQKLYLLKVTDKKITINISNRLTEKNDVEYAHPDFIKKRINR